MTAPDLAKYCIAKGNFLLFPEGGEVRVRGRKNYRQQFLMGLGPTRN
jgi:hypothetical protein